MNRTETARHTKSSTDGLLPDTIRSLSQRDGCQSAVVTLCLAYLSSAIVVSGVIFGVDFLPRQLHPHQGPVGKVQALGSWDGVWYQRIVAEGYHYETHEASSVAYFPLFPLLATALRWVTSLSPLHSLLVVSYTSLLLSWLAILAYVRSRTEDADVASVMLCLALWPIGIFFRFAYSEPLFLFLAVLTLLGVHRQWPSFTIALIAGAATGTRSVGIALLFPLLWDWWRRSNSVFTFGARVLGLAPFACWGLLAYMIFLHLQFGDALAFAKTQVHWGMRSDLAWPTKVLTLMTCEPIWSIYIPSSDAYWARHDYVESPLFSLQFWNPIYFVSCIGLVAYGAWRRWLTPPEWLFTVGVLGIPYVVQAYRMMMLGHGRFTCVVFPMFLVLGRIISRLPSTVAVIVYALMAVQLFYWSALFAAWHRVF
jgi:hypothetical protein